MKKTLVIIAALLGFVLILAGGVLLYFLNSPALRFESDFDQGRTEELPDLYNRKIRGRPIEENLLRLRMNGKAEKLAEDYLLRRSDYETTVRKLSVLQEIPLYFLENEIESSLLDIEKRHRKETGEEEAANAGEQVPGDAEDTDAPAEDTGASDAPEESTEPTEAAAETVTETEAPEETEAAATETETEKATEKPTEKETEKPTEPATEKPTETETEPEPVVVEVETPLTSVYYSVTQGGIQIVRECSDVYGTVYKDVIAGTVSNLDNTVEYDLSKGYESFSGLVIRDSKASNANLQNPNRTDITLSVYGDGVLLYRSVSANLPGGEKQEFSVDVKGVKTLRIVINGMNFIRLCNAKLVSLQMEGTN